MIWKTYFPSLLKESTLASHTEKSDRIMMKSDDIITWPMRTEWV
ncbi:MAG: hypothetical protein AAF824_09565 [Bacteroidota bacterium]